MDEKLYSIKESTLTDIGDALRRKHGETKMGTIIVEETVPDVVVSKTPNATGFFTFNDSAYEAIKTVYPITILGASSIKVRFTYNISSANYRMEIASGVYESNSLFPAGMKSYNGNSTEIVELIFENTQSITIYLFVSGVKGQGYYAEITGLDENGNPINGKTIQVEKEAEVPNTYSSNEMAQAIDDIEIGDVLPDEAFLITGDCSYRFANGGWDWYLNLYKDNLVFTEIGNANYMFNASKVESVPSIDFKQTSYYYSMNNMFGNCKDVKEIGTLKNLYPSDMVNIFNGCWSLRELPQFENLNLNRIYSYATSNCTNAFSNCYSLRSIPEDFLKQLYQPLLTGYYYSFLYGAFSSCFTLDEIKGLNPQTGTITSNMLSSTFNNCYRLKNIIFAMQDDGMPYKVNWKSQTIDLSSFIGFTAAVAYITGYNSGITADKEVKDDATYAALKDNPDWFASKLEYSRYNHDSAVNTINSLPDTSAYLATAGGTNTIKFKGAAGSATDGGAINTLTAEEIAVAAAKGWTVTLA